VTGSSQNSQTRLISDLKAGDEEAASELWSLYFDKLVRLARSRLGSNARRVADEEDVALSVLKSLCVGAARGRFQDLTDRDDLWALLLTITRRKSTAQMRHNGRQKRGGGKVRGESVFFRTGESSFSAGINEIIGEEPTPSMLAALNEQHRRLLEMLHDDTLREMALLRLEGYTTEEIAEKQGVTSRTVRRKLNLIRNTWLKELTVE